ncbi:hypothetical protein LO772_18785 [Yinghuangia sp. ASG 101]|uniref:hypothetical protein n=1 Tax=Yinghuangia sp. ASG 101 TaxID=2896848 RepID=UPI001E4DA428|nr:hypothetical protein [Yinghuangia sp. ASG 101]UGQ09017.1 hypothetical protein LO772_18785 [Yinghuangia sp. ASG 101]
MKTGLVRLILAEDKIPEGNPDKPPGRIGEGVNTLMNWGSWIVMAVCGLAVLVAAGRMAMAHKSGADGGQHIVGLAWIVVAATLAGSGAAIVNTFIDG